MLPPVGLMTCCRVRPTSEKLLVTGLYSRVPSGCVTGLKVRLKSGRMPHAQLRLVGSLKTAPLPVAGFARGLHLPRHRRLLLRQLNHLLQAQLARRWLAGCNLAQAAGNSHSNNNRYIDWLFIVLFWKVAAIVSGKVVPVIFCPPLRLIM